MNPPSTGLWNDPPPPGMEDEKYLEKNNDKYTPEAKNLDHSDDPHIKSPHYLDYQETQQHSKHRDGRHHGHHRRRSRSRPSHDRYKSRSRSRDRDKKRRRSRSKRHRRSPSQSSRHRHHRSISHSRSPSYERSSRKHKEKKRRRRSRSARRHSRSRSRSRSGNYKTHYSKGSRKSRLHSHSPISDKNDYSDNENNKEEDKFEEEDEAETVQQNAFKNDGSFLELFRKMQEEQQKAQATKTEAGASEVKIPTFGKRRGGRVLKTGVVVKTKAEDESDCVEPQDPWSIYLKEVKRYKEACCDDDSKTRPLVK